MEGAGTRTALAWRMSQGRRIRGTRPCFRPNHPASGSTTQNRLKKARISWSTIIRDMLTTLNAPDAVYMNENFEGMTQVHIHFRVPVDKSQTIFEDVVVHGITCPDLWLPESTATMAALEQFQRTPFHGRIIDVSYLRCEEMERNCNQLLVKGGEVYRGVKLLLSDYEDSMEKAEGCYKLLCAEVVEYDRHGTDRVYGDTLFDIAKRIYALNRENYPKFKEMFVESKEIKGAEWDVRSRSEHHFRDRSHEKPEKRVDDIPAEIKVSMKAVFHEMISSLGWEEPVHNVTRTGTSLSVCETVLTPKPFYLGSGTKTVTISGAECTSHIDAVESACQAAIMFMDTNMSIHLVDVNYLKRSHAELYLSEAREVARRAISMADKVLVEWEKMIDGLHACEEHCWNIVMEHPEKEPWNQVYNLKYQCADDVSHLYAACLGDLVRAKDRHSLLSTWTNEQVDVKGGNIRCMAPDEVI